MQNTSLIKRVRAMDKKVDYGEQPLQMDDYGIDKRHYGRHGDCTISPTYDDYEKGKEVNDETDEELQP